jgi:aryl-alcohol dehydrogenase-like predicted oxidoreductase
MSFKLYSFNNATFQERGVELAQLAQYYTMTRPEIATHLVGMNSQEVLRSNLDILNNGLSTLQKQVLQEISTQYVVIVLIHVTVFCQSDHLLI